MSFIEDSVVSGYLITENVSSPVFLGVLFRILLFRILLPPANAVLKMLEEGVSGGLSDAGVKVCFVGCVDGEGTPIWEGEVDDVVLVNLTVRVYEGGGSEESVSWPLWEFGLSFFVGLVVVVYFLFDVAETC